MCDPTTASLVIVAATSFYAASQDPDVPDAKGPKLKDPAKAQAAANQASKTKQKQLLAQFSEGDTNVTGGLGLGPVPQQYLGKKVLLGP